MNSIGYRSSTFIFLAFTLFDGGYVFAQGEVFDYQTGGRGTRLWVPSSVDRIRGILIYGNGAGGDSRDEIFTPWYRGLAQTHDFAVIGTSMWGNLSGTEIDLWEDHLAALASVSGYPELVHAPWAPIGFSNGGQMSYGFNALRPEKTIAFIANKGCCYNDRLPSESALRTPGILIAGELDTATRRYSIQALFDDNRPRGALWSWVEQQGLAHQGRADSLVIPFIDEAIRLRYPGDQTPTATSGVQLLDLEETDGWLADQSTWKSGLTRVASYHDYTGDKTAAGWLISDNIAHLYRALSTYDRGSDINIVLPPPFDQFVDDIEIWLSEESPAEASFRIDVSKVDDWSKIELFDRADLRLELTPGNVLEQERLVQLTIGAGVHAFSALVTHADGSTVSTTDIVAMTVVPEPGSLVLATSLLAIIRGMRRRLLTAA